jgi:hypothetical protein
MRRLAETAMAAAHLIGGGTESLRRGAFAIVRAMGDGGVPPQVAAQLPGFDTALLAADTDLVSLADQLAAAPTLPACGILLAGPPGSGKSAFARHLEHFPIMLGRIRRRRSSWCIRLD